MEEIDYNVFLMKKYNKVSLSPTEMAEELNITKRMLVDRANVCSAEIPPFVRVGRKLAFPIKGVAKFLENTVCVI